MRHGLRDKCHVRVNPEFRLAMQIDPDEGNAANIRSGMIGYSDGIQLRRG